MRPIAERRILRLFAGTQIGSLCFCSFKKHIWGTVIGIVFTITKRLIFTVAAGTPSVFFAFH